ncbi:MAG TPA: DUF423 domain-containing protein [Casimicrobiaceae bacterium]|nr:DUF423 domain-containing protein [Casimicrobiaceae bacterium]
MSPRLTLTAGALLMAAAVALGALGAHALKTRLSPDMLELWHTAVTYHAWHALALLTLGTLQMQMPRRAGLGRAALLFVAGIALFSGSLYAMALGGGRAWGYVTPFGGLAFIAGWLLLAVAVARAPNPEPHPLTPTLSRGAGEGDERERGG